MIGGFDPKDVPGSSPRKPTFDDGGGFSGFIVLLCIVLLVWWLA